MTLYKCQIAALKRVHSILFMPGKWITSKRFSSKAQLMMESQSSCPPESQASTDDCFKILLATDIHLGYKEKDIVIGILFILFLHAFACHCMFR